MSSRREKGNRLQNIVASYLQKKGYSVHNQKSIAKKIYTPKGEIWISWRNDIWGAFDILASNERELRFIQVTSDSNLESKVNKIKQVKIPYNVVSVEIWQYKDKGKWRLLKFDGNELKEFCWIIRRKEYYKCID